ncbi:MAG: hypothetical protein KIT45_12200 [Fimbriimonadia bacterium]|nr:hypothetical protein [Fimbriimonadia bacterium]
MNTQPIMNTQNKEMTGLEVAVKADIPISRIVGLRHGWITPRPNERKRLAQVLHCKPEEVEKILSLEANQ